MVTVGKNILENLTTGMYLDSRISFREYIQNACDQIDLAIHLGILKSDEGEIEIYIDEAKRYISIKDNATGSKANEFAQDLGDIANSNKELGKNKGFRGIGRLCGLAYCKTLKFSTSYYGENIASIMTCDAQKMRELLASPIKYTVEQVWGQIIQFDTKKEDAEKHYFEVELFDIGQAHSGLLNKQDVVEYLSFVAPVPYKNTFFLCQKVYEHAKQIHQSIDEYRVLVNGEQLFKNYTTKLKEESGTNIKNYDEISDLEFKDFYDENKNLIAWMWVGLSRFEKVIPKINKMRGIRLRSSNIQLGDEDTLQKRNLFKENRGNNYFVGEVFAVDTALKPNSQRDYFSENENRVLFEKLLKRYFFDTLTKIYYAANGLKNAIKAQQEYVEKLDEFNSKATTGGFVDDTSKEKLRYEVDVAKEKAEKAKKQISKFDDIDSNTALAKVSSSIKGKYDIIHIQEKATTTTIVEQPSDKKDTYITSRFSKLSKADRKLVSKVMAIICDIAPKEIAEQIIDRLTKEFK